MKATEWIAIFVSVVALGTSLGSYMLAQKAWGIQKTEFEGKYKPVWSTSVEKNEILFKNLESYQTPQYLMVRPPDDIIGGSKSWLLSLSDARIDFDEIRENTIASIRESLSYSFTGHAVFHIPLIVHTNFTVNGENFKDTSQYFLLVLFEIKEREKECFTEPKSDTGCLEYSANPVDLIFHKRIDANRIESQYDEFINVEWANRKSRTINKWSGVKVGQKLDK